MKGKRVGLITNSAGVDSRLRPTAQLLAGADGVQFAALFAPEHGLAGSLAAGERVEDRRDPVTGVPVHSLYGKTRRPTAEMLRGIDVLIYDLQDVGARPYTYLSTLVGALESARAAGIELWVLDRPDPLGGRAIDGPVLDRKFESFVGPHAVPLRHAMTPGEFARLVNEERGIGARLRVVAMEGWRRGMAWEETGLPWVAPSPNIPTPATCHVYPGFVLIEGTNLSEGRGTTRPFHLFGAPWLDGRAVAEWLNLSGLAGVAFRAVEFTPTDSKHRGALCGGVEVHVLDPAAFRAAAAVVEVLRAVMARHPAEFKFLPESFDRLAGSDALRRALEEKARPEAITGSWAPGQEDFLRRRARFLLYR